MTEAEAQWIEAQAQRMYQEQNPGKRWEDLNSAHRSVWWVRARDMVRNSLAVASHAG